jgi:predicted metal-dependent phosphoesterase TrpH
VLALSTEQDVHTFKTHHYDHQFEDYSKVYAPCFDPEQKAKVRAEVFPIDCEKAFSMGARLVRELR